MHITGPTRLAPLPKLQARHPMRGRQVEYGELLEAVRFTGKVQAQAYRLAQFQKRTGRKHP